MLVFFYISIKFELIWCTKNRYLLSDRTKTGNTNTYSHKHTHIYTRTHTYTLTETNTLPIEDIGSSNDRSACFTYYLFNYTEISPADTEMQAKISTLKKLQIMY